MYYIIYKISNKINGKIYIGSHKTSNLNDTYMGSGKYLKYAQEKYGIENFTKEILFVFNTPEEMYAKEKELVNEEFISTQNTYNLKVGGFGGWDYINANINIDQKSKAGKMVDAIYGLEYRKSIGSKGGKVCAINKLGAFDRTKYTVEQLKCNAQKASELALTPEVKEKRKSTFLENAHQQGSKNSQFGTMWITNDIENKKIKTFDTIPSGWRKGRKLK